MREETHQRGGYHLPLSAGCGGEGGGEFCGEGFREDHRRVHGAPYSNLAGAYGIPELSDMHKDAVVHAKFTANPGCHASGFVILVYPLVASGMIPKETPSPYFPSPDTPAAEKDDREYESPEKPELYSTPRIYGLNLKHKHLPEMQKICGLDVPPVFCPDRG